MAYKMGDLPKDAKTTAKDASKDCYIGKALNPDKLAQLANLPDTIDGGTFLDMEQYKDNSKSGFSGTEIWKNILQIALVSRTGMSPMEAYKFVDSL